MKAKLVLEDGTTLRGEGFGYLSDTAGEVVFSTAMTGYTESLTDPSYFGQILTLTYPLVGNYGVPCPSFFQSKKIQISGLVVSKHCLNPSHNQNQKTLDRWLKENFIPAISEIDTRALTQKIRQKGTILGKIKMQKDIPFYDPNKENLVAKVSLRQPETYSSNDFSKTICLIDCGYKKAILEKLIQKGLNVIVVPWNFNPFNLNRPFSGIVISNGPGNPKMAKETIAIVKEAIGKKIPLLGICLGNQILALAAGAETYKLKFGHRSLNQPVKDLFNQKCYITSQNHGFNVAVKTLPPFWQSRFINLNDQTCEGIISKDRLFMGVQFHPEGHPGPEDTEFIFDEFVKKLT